MAEITVRYAACDGYRKTRKFKTLAGARKFAVRCVGENPEHGSNYAVSSDGIGTVRVDGVTLRELFGISVADFYGLDTRDFDTPDIGVPFDDEIPY